MTSIIDKLIRVLLLNFLTNFVEEKQLPRGKLEQNGIPHGYPILFIGHFWRMPIAILTKYNSY